MNNHDEFAAFWRAMLSEREQAIQRRFSFDRAAAHWAQASAVTLFGRVTTRVVSGGYAQPVRRLSGGLLRTSKEVSE